MSAAEMASERRALALAYHDLGYHPVPLPLGEKAPPPDGRTGHAGRNMTRAEIEAHDWSRCSIGVRLPDGVIGIDVDVYNGGDDDLAEAVKRFGPLPATVMTTARGDGSGIKLLRVPAGTSLGERLGRGIQIIQWFHRYAVWPWSTNPKHRDAPYRFIDEQSGEELDLPPEVGELPALPWAWLDGLAKSSNGRRAERAATADEIAAFIDEHTEALRPSGLKGICTKLDNRTKGRHDTLVEVACWAMREAAAGWYPVADALDVLGRWWDEVMDDQARRDGPEFGAALCWAIAEAVAEPERIAVLRIEAKNDDVVDPDLPVDWHDAHVGQAFAAHLGDEWMYVTPWRRWVRWDGRRYARDEVEAIHEVARLWIIDIGMEVFRTPGNNGDTLKKIASYKAAGKLEAIVKVARRIKAVDPSVFDQHPHLLNCHNGVVDLRTGQLGPHDPALRLTKLAGASYSPGAVHADVAAALACMTPIVAASVQQHLGVSASGHTGADHIAVFDGKGSNGKTTLIVAATAALDDYAGAVPNELGMQSHREDHPTVKMTLLGLRFAYIEETEEDGGLRLERLKAISGGGEITGRFIGADYYTFESTHTLTIATNHRPIVNTSEYAVWRRLRLVPFPYRYVNEPAREADRPIDTGLRQRLRDGRAQREAMLSWIVAGAVAAYHGGCVPEVAWCSEIMDATDEWWRAEDVIGRFLSDCVTFGPDQRVKGSELFGAWRAWCDGEGRPPGQAKNFHRRFQDHNEVVAAVEVLKPKGSIAYVGVGLRSPWG